MRLKTLVKIPEIPGKARERRERFGNFTKMRSLRA
jgi:hypothetical protein